MTVTDDWSIDDAEDLYRVPAWSDGFFTINDKGHVAVSPFDDHSLTIDVMDVVAEARRRKLGFPLLVRFQDILHARVQRLNRAFSEAIDAVGYQNTYRGVYPIKVNQLHEVVEEVLDAGKPFGLGLECGSKAELLATLPHLESDETLLVCNGVKDTAMLSLIVAAQRLGKNVVPVMEKYVEFEQLMAIADREEREARFGVRIRLRTSGAGKWADSGGYRSKFGISLPELMDLVERLEAEDRRDCFVLLHFHLGSQISDIKQLRSAAKEMSQIYAELVTRGIPIRYLDVGGGVGVRYTGGFESGRAMTAHHSMLVVETLGAFRKDRSESDYEPPPDAHRLVHTLHETLAWLRDEATADTPVAELQEAYHDIESVHEEASTLFGMGYLSLVDNARVERLYWSACSNALRRLRDADVEPVPPAVQDQPIRFFQRRQELPGAACAGGGRALLSRRIHDGGLPGHHGRRTQPVWPRVRGSCLRQSRRRQQFLARENHSRYGNRGHPRHGAVFSQ